MGAETLDFRLPDECDAAWASAFHEDILRAGLLPCDVRLDASGVSRMTTIAVQLIASLAKSIAADGFGLHVALPTPAFNAAFADLGFGEILAQMGS